PTLLECLTYRTRPHAEGMSDFTYRSRAEVDEWKLRCPIRRLKRQLLEQKSAVEADFEALERDLATLVEEAHEFAERSPWPNPATATHHVLADPAHADARRPAPSGPPAFRELTFAQATLEALRE